MISRILAFSIQRRWLVVVLTLGAVALGLWSLPRLPIDAVPDITNKQVQINTTAFALSASEIEKQVTFRIETALAGIPGLDSTRSISRSGFSQVTAVFTEQTDIYFARQQLNERLLELRSTLPPGAEPRLGPVSTGLGEIYIWSVGFAPEARHGVYVTPEGDRLNTDIERAAYLRTVQDWIVRPQIKSVPGVAGVDSIGGYVKQYQVQPDPLRLVALGLSFADIVKAIEADNVSRGASVIERNGEGIVVRTGGRLRNSDEIGDVVISTRGSVPVRIRDVAQVVIGGEIRTGAASLNGSEAVIGTALMLIGSNSRSVADAVDSKIEEVRRTLPAGIEIRTLLDRTQLVDATIRTVATNLGEGALLVIGVLFVLLGNFRAALIAALVIPIAMLMTATGMLHGRISANLMSLGALDFGLIVDGAVIIAENALRHLAQKQAGGRTVSLSERLKCVQTSAEEMIAPTVYGQVIIILVYTPLLTFSGVEGKMFEPMALTVILALLSAFVLSLTFVPAMIAIAITGTVREGDNAMVRRLKALYSPRLKDAIRRPWPAIAGAVALFAIAMLLFLRLGQEFIPTLDEKNLAMHAMRVPSTSLTHSQAMQFDVENKLRALPQVAFVFSKTGTAEIASDPMPPNVSDTFIILKPHSQWPDPRLSKSTLLEQIEAAVQELPGNNYEFTQPIEMRFNELLAGVRGDIAVKVFGDEFEPMLQAANRIAAIFQATKGAVDVKVEQVSGLAVLDINVDKAAIARRGLSLASVQDVIGTAIGGRDAGVVFEADRHFEIVVRLAETIRNDLEALKSLPVSLPRSGDGPAMTVPLGEIATFTVSEGPNQISRDNGKRRVVVTANVRDRDIASVVNDARAQIDSQISLPAGYWLNWSGQFENLQAARQRLMVVVPACFVVIFLLLTSALGSARDALLVFSAIPLALTGGAITLWLRGMPFSVSAAVGFIALSGIAVLNGLVMLTFVKQLMANGLGKEEAIYQGALTRLRPIATTALVASLGFLPMALATGTGAEVQRPIATVVIGGLISATLLTLFVLPALYSRFGRGEEHDAKVSEKLRRAAE